MFFLLIQILILTWLEISMVLCWLKGCFSIKCQQGLSENARSRKLDMVLKSEIDIILISLQLVNKYLIKGHLACPSTYAFSWLVPIFLYLMSLCPSGADHKTLEVYICKEDTRCHTQNKNLISTWCITYQKCWHSKDRRKITILSFL